MLSKVISPAQCAACKNCCVFEAQSAWELPLFSAAAVRRLEGRSEYTAEQVSADRYRITLPYDETHRAQPCPFLDPHRGCMLPAEEKPIACKLWPIRVMPDAEGKPALTLYRGCPALPEEKLGALYELLGNGLREQISEAITAEPELILPYHKNYRYL